jgi:hypothetical protein
MTSYSRGAALRPSFANATKVVASQKRRGGGAPEGAMSFKPRHTIGCCHLIALRARQRAVRQRARLSALHRGSCRGDRTPRLSPGRASRQGEGAGVTRAVNDA